MLQSDDGGDLSGFMPNGENEENCSCELLSINSLNPNHSSYQMVVEDGNIATGKLLLCQ